jgi:hypothetical protein
VARMKNELVPNTRIFANNEASLSADATNGIIKIPRTELDNIKIFYNQ